MTKLEISLPDQTESEIQRLVDQGEFLNRDQAIEELLSRGVSVYRETETSDTEPTPEEEMFGQTANERQDPAMTDDEPDDYTL